MATRDVTVLGAGIFGLSIAWACLKRGASVRVIDPGGIGAGSSGGIVGALAPHVPENWNPKKAFQLDSLLMAEAWWHEVAAHSDLDPGYARSGRVQPLADELASELAQAREAGARTLWGEAARWAVTDDPQGWRLNSPTGLFVHDTLSARLHPRLAGRALGAAIAARGGEIVPDGSQDGAVVHATGWQGLHELSEALGSNVGGGVKGQSASFALDVHGRPQLFAEGLHIIPHADGTVAIGSTSEREFDDPGATDAQLDALIAKARGLVPELENAPVIDRWAGVRPRAKSRAPMLGVWPGRSGHFIANGGFKIGFGMAPKIAEVMADLLLDGRDVIPDGFRVEDNLPG